MSRAHERVAHSRWQRTSLRIAFACRSYVRVLMHTHCNSRSALRALVIASSKLQLRRSGADWRHWLRTHARVATVDLQVEQRTNGKGGPGDADAFRIRTRSRSG